MNSETLHVQIDDVAHDLAANIHRKSDEWIVLLHGWGAAKECFDEAFMRPELQKYSLAAIDMLGYGESARPHDFSYDLQDQARVIDAAIHSLGAKSVHLVGHSMGGGVGLLCAQEMPGIVRQFVSVEGNLVSEDTSKITRLLAAQPYTVFRGVTFPFVKFVLRSSRRADYQAWGSWMMSADPWAVHRSAKSLAYWSDKGDLMAKFKSLPVKAYVCGENSGSDKTLHQLADVDVRKIPHSKHFSMIDNPEAFYQNLAAIISGR